MNEQPHLVLLRHTMLGGELTGRLYASWGGRYEANHFQETRFYPERTPNLCFWNMSPEPFGHRYIPSIFRADHMISQYKKHAETIHPNLE